jgi:hypothetical protein
MTVNYNDRDGPDHKAGLNGSTIDQFDEVEITFYHHSFDIAINLLIIIFVILFHMYHSYWLISAW